MANHHEDLRDVIKKLRRDVDALRGAAVTVRTAYPCTSTTRPASPPKYLVIFETDTNMLGVWTGTAWKHTAALT